MSDNEYPDEYLDENGNPCEAEPEQKRGELKPCPFCGTLPQANAWIFRGISETRYFCPNQECPLSVRTVTLEEWNTRPIEDALNARIAQLEKEIARRDEELLELNNKAVFIKFENEDELPAEIKDDVYSAMFECSHVDGVRLFPYIEENGQKYFLVMLKEVV